MTEEELRKMSRFEIMKYLESKFLQNVNDRKEYNKKNTDPLTGIPYCKDMCVLDMESFRLDNSYKFYTSWYLYFNTHPFSEAKDILDPKITEKYLPEFYHPNIDKRLKARKLPYNKTVFGKEEKKREILEQERRDFKSLVAICKSYENK